MISAWVTSSGVTAFSRNSVLAYRYKIDLAPRVVARAILKMGCIA